MKTVKFRRWTCQVVKTKYMENERTALLLKEVDSGEPIATATVNLPDIPVPDNNHVFIKSWSENEGMLEALVEAGIVEDLKTNVPTGFVVANYAKVLI